MLELLKQMINEINVKKFCKDDISLIENYDKAIADKTQTWDCHHRRETVLSRKDLIEIGEYYNRPACELIFLTHSEHISIHKKNNKNCIGKHQSIEYRTKMSKAMKGKNLGKHLSAEHRAKLSRIGLGKRRSIETRNKISAAKLGNTNVRGMHWYNNGVKSIRAKTCPDGFVPGRLK